MAGQIKHSWNGTVLTIESDSGISSADLKGAKGDTGIRGAQGRAGEGAFTYEDFTPEQLSALKGEKGEDGDILLLSTAKGKAISINDSSNSNIIGLNMSGAAENPVIYVCSKNMFDMGSICDGSYGNFATAENSLTFTYDSSYGNYFAFSYWLAVKPNTNYIISMEGNKSLSSIFAYSDKLFGNQLFIKNLSVTAQTFSFNSGENTRILIGFYSTKASRDESVTEETISNIQIETGTVKTEFEKGNAPQVVTIPYAFAEGDFLTLENGRVNTVGGDITDTETGQAILALHTNKPNTTIISDMDCSVVYKADITTAYNNLLARVAALEGGNS